VFAGFDPAVVAAFGAREIEALVGDAGIVRHRGKIEATVGNARAFCEVQARHGSFAGYIWGFVDGVPVVTRRAAGEPLPASTALSDRVSADLRRLGFRFVGSTIVYSFLQAAGLVDDHYAYCFRSKR
jgi:DNA-3-methyladenine glycosylase I